MAAIQQTIAAKLTKTFEPAHLAVINESGMHNVPPGSETHFKVVVVANIFHDKPLIERHRLVNEALSELLAGPVHALSISCKVSTSSRAACWQCIMEMDPATASNSATL